METESMENIENDAITHLTNIISKRGDYLRIIWCMGLGDGTGLVGLLEHLTVKAVSNMVEPKHIIRLSMPSILYQYYSNQGASKIEIKTYIAIAIANQLGILDGSSTSSSNEITNKFKKLKEELDEELFYNYTVNKQKEWNLVDGLVGEIFEKLRSTSYVLVIENFYALYCTPSGDSAQEWLLESGWLPEPSKWNGARWVISAHRNNFIDERRDVTLDLRRLIGDKDWPLKGQQLVEVALQLACAQSESQSVAPLQLVRVRGTVTESTMHILRSCLLYSLLFSPHVLHDGISGWLITDGKYDLLLKDIHRLPGMINIPIEEIRHPVLKYQSKFPNFYVEKEESEREKRLGGAQYINCIDGHKELVRFWIAEGLFQFPPTILSSSASASAGEQERAAHVVFEALLSHSLIQHDYSSLIAMREHTYENLLFDSPPFPFFGMHQLLSGSYLGKLHINDISNPINWENKPWISLVDNRGQWITHPKPNKTTTFLHKANSSTSLSTIDTLLTTMSNLRVLDFSYSSLEALPSSIANLVNLRLLSLKSCRKLRTLKSSELDSSHSPIEKLQQLEVLNLSGVPLAQIPEEIGWQKRCLYFLDLSCPNITSLPQNLFVEMSGIRELSLLGCKSLKSLPPSLVTCLLHLEEFSLSETQLHSLPRGIFEQMQRLRMLKLTGNRCLVHLPNSLSRASMLQELQIHDCTSLQEVNVAGHPSLKSFSLSKSPHIVCLSLRACHVLETIALSDLDNLSKLDLSFTSITEFPLEVCNQGSLTRLDLISIPRLNRVPWHELSQPLPEVFNLVQHGYEVMGNQGLVVQNNVDESLPLLEDGIGVKIFVTDTRLLSRFETSQPLLGNQQTKPRPLYVSVCNQRQSKEITCKNQFPNKNPYYKDVPLIEYKFKQHFDEHHLSRQVEISSVGRYLFGLEGILSFTESLLVRDVEFVSSLTDLNPEYPELQECKLDKCHLMEVVFRETNYKQGKKLQNLWVSNLLNLTDVLHGSFRFDEFWALKYVNLRDCPRLVSVFPGNLKLPYLETLSIVCCYSLRSIFYYYGPNDEDQFPRLRSIKLHQLPQLSQLYDKQKHPFRMPEWEELSFRGCWSLRRLPLLTRPRDCKVLVDGDIRQCKAFHLEMDKDQLSCYHFKSLPPVTSFKERVKNRIFLK